MADLGIATIEGMFSERFLSLPCLGNKIIISRGKRKLIEDSRWQKMDISRYYLRQRSEIQENQRTNFQKGLRNNKVRCKRNLPPSQLYMSNVMGHQNRQFERIKIRSHGILLKAQLSNSLIKFVFRRDIYF
jgi:hypothetical protein